MAEVCAFNGDCPMMGSITSISGFCTEVRGETCGPVAAYGMLTYEKEGLVDADETTPIVGSFTFDTVPAGDPPLEVREEWVGVTVPVRYPEGVARGDVTVSSDDVELSLLAHGKLDAAMWFTRLARSMGGFKAIFQASEGEFADCEVTSSADYYGAKLSALVRALIEED